MSSLPLRAPELELMETLIVWTAPNYFADLPEFAPELLEELQKSSLCILKGDLNYRKLTSDACWPTTTPFEVTLGESSWSVVGGAEADGCDSAGPLRGKIDLLSLRTCKADVCVGLAEGKAEELDASDPNWRVSGKYVASSLICFASSD